MSEDHDITTPSAADDAPAGKPRRFGWPRMLLAASIVLMVVGLGLGAYAGIRHSDAGVDGGGGGGGIDPALVQGLAPVDGGGGRDPVEGAEGSGDAMAEWSPVVFRLGFSFFAGFAIAYALRTFLKMTVVVAGVVLLLMFGLQYAGLITVDWAAVDDRYDSISAWLSGQTESFMAFVMGYLPSAGSASAGLVAGFRRR